MIIIGVGSNLPFCTIDSQQIVLSAISAFAAIGSIASRASLYRSPAWPDPSHPDYINTVFSARSDLSPEALLSALQAIEAGFGRRRSQKNAPRTLDLDIIAHGDLVTGGSDETLILPHPRMHERDFVLAPLAEIAPDWRHPVSGARAGDLLAALPTRTARKL
ncbi:MAG: 2-amino-4-hydroxy-6-hydroxymethyldihydropteridine diphosphokinase [Pseudomonadota bacterium]